VIDAMVTYLQAHELHLGGFTTINHKIPVLNFHQLRTGMPTVSRHSTTGTEYGNFKAHA
jgi:hypothetical protein